MLAPRCVKIKEIASQAGVVFYVFSLRKCNDVAHRYAHLGFSLASETRWLDVTLSIIQNVLIEDSS